VLLESAGELEQRTEVDGAGQQRQLDGRAAECLDLVAQLVLGGPAPGVLGGLGGQRVGQPRDVVQPRREQPRRQVRAGVQRAQHDEQGQREHDGEERARPVAPERALLVEDLPGGEGHEVRER